MRNNGASKGIKGKQMYKEKSIRISKRLKMFGKGGNKIEFLSVPFNHFQLSHLSF